MATKTTTSKKNDLSFGLDAKNTDDLLRLFIENAKDYAIVLLDINGNVLSWNMAAERLKGWKASEIIGKSFGLFYSPEDVKKGKPEMELREAKKEGRFEDENWRIRKNGERFWANVVLTPLYDKSNKLCGFGKITRDFSDRKKSEEKIIKQAQEILEMATVPVVQVWEGIVLVPLIGTLDSTRTQQLMELLLQRIMDSNSSVAVIDITGVPTIDTQTAQHLIETISAVRLLGSEVVLTGVRPAIAQTLVHLSIDLSNVITRSSLATGLGMALQLINLKVVSDN
jgi:PAS domain S-box-containing protein